MDLHRFEIAIPQAVLDDLAARLSRTRWPDDIAGEPWSYGSDQAALKRLVAYWRERFDWREQERMLNRFAHFRADVNGLGIHFIHERGRGPKPLPLVLTHGWPDSFTRMLKVIPLLADPAAHGADAADSFDVVVPSLPGYGFSDKPTAAGITPRVADCWAELMSGLGYARFGAHGGDMGSTITQQLGQSHARSLIGLHLTDVPWHNYFFFDGDRSKLSKAEQQYFADGQKWNTTEGAYASMQATKPMTPAIGLNDSPAGLAAWIVEKYHAWSDCNGKLANCFSDDELLTNVMIYWATQTIATSFLYYWEPAHGRIATDTKRKVEVPTGFAIFPKDLLRPPRQWAERFFNVQRWSEMPRGGHYAAMEQPELLAEDIRAFFRPLRQR